MHDRGKDETLDPAQRDRALPETVAGCRGSGPLAPERIPEHVGAYRIEAVLGRGAMGVVYRAVHEQLGRTVALKMIRPGRFASETAIRRFHQEAASIAQLEHPSIVPLYEVGQQDGFPFFSMKLIDGSSLAERLDDYRKDLKAGIRIVAEVAKAIHFAHQRGVLHRDLKPANILIEHATGRPFVVDFGLARPVDRQVESLPGGVLGTPNYMPPEQARGEPVTTAGDVYSLGAILFELLTGRTPFEGDSVTEVLAAVGRAQRIPPPSAFVPEVDPGLDAIVQKAMAAAPEDRYHSAIELADDLERWLRGEILSVQTPTAGQLIQVWLRQNLRSAVGALVVGSASGIAVGLAVYYGFVVPAFTEFGSIYDQLKIPRPFFLRFPIVGPTLEAELSFFWGDMLGIAIVVVLAMTGFVNALVVRPKNRAGALAAGVVAGLMTALLSFAIGVGWLMTMTNLAEQTAPDIVLLARSLSASEGERELAERAFLLRYPGLSEFDPDRRGTVLANLILGNQIGAIPVGLWGGLVTMFCLGIVPCIAGTVLGWHGLAHETRWWKALLRYGEVAVSACLFVMFGLIWTVGPAIGLGGFRPTWPVQISFLAVLAGATFGAYRRVAWGWRLAAIAAAGALFGVQHHQSRQLDRAIPAARQAYEQGQLDAAIQRLERYRNAAPEAFTAHFHLAALYVRAGRPEAFRKEADALLRTFARTDSPSALSAIAWVVLLGPARPEQQAAAAETAQLVARCRKPKRPPPLAPELAVALAHLRAGRPGEALRQLESLPDDPARPITSRLRQTLRARALAELNDPGRQETARALTESLQRAPRPTGAPWILLISLDCLQAELVADVAPEAPS